MFDYVYKEIHLFRNNFNKYFDEPLLCFDNEKETKISLISPSVPALLSHKTSSSEVSETSNIHDVIKKVQDSMDHLRSDLLQKDMPTFANDVGKLNQNLEATRKKQEGIDRIKQEQEVLKLERVRLSCSELKG